MPMYMHSQFHNTAWLGHYAEFVMLQPGGEAFFADVPRN